MADDAVKPLFAHCPYCDYDLGGLKPEVVLCPECGANLRVKPSFWKDGDYHYAWALAAVLVPGLCILLPASDPFWGVWRNPKFVEDVLDALYGPQAIGCCVVPLLAIAHLLVAVRLAGRRSIYWHGVRVEIVVGLIVPLDLFALFLHWGVFALSRG